MDNTQQRKDLEVAIVGGGVCGLVCAIALKRRGINAQIYEAASHFGEIGAGIGIGGNAVRILRELGLIDDIWKRSEGANRDMSKQGNGWFHFRSGLEGHELIYDYMAQPGDVRLGAHRAAFLDALVPHLPQGTTHFNKRCVRVSTEAAKAKLEFADGTTATADVVLGADGIKSVVREAVTGVDAFKALKFGNTGCYRGLVPAQAARAAGLKRNFPDRPVCYMGQDKHIIVFPIADGVTINVAAFAADYDSDLGDHAVVRDAPTVERVSTKQLLDAYEGWGSEVTTLLGCIKDPTRWTINVVYPPLQSYVNGRVALLGDAAHAMLPHLGAGAGQGIEDAEILARLLGHPETSTDNIADVLLVYDEVRRPRAQSVWDGSLRAGRIYDYHGESGALPEGIQSDLRGIRDFIWDYDLGADEQRAIRTLRERGVFEAS